MTDFEIEDEDNLVDRSKKQSIVKKRDAIDEWRKELIPKAKFGEISETAAVSLIHDRVRDYLMAVEPVMRAKEATEIYQEKLLGKVTVPVPEPWNDPEGNGIGYKGELPTPETVPVEGVVSVIDGETVAATWESQVRIDNANNPRQTVEFGNRVPFSREVLRNAVRHTDMWLQQENLGISVKDEVEADEDDLNPL